jgi:hypothetical protein
MEPELSNPQPRKSWAWPTAFMVVMVTFTGAAVFAFRSCRDLPVEVADRAFTALDKASSAAADVASAFNRGTVTTSFISYATTLASSQYFQFATLRQMELFEQKDEATTAFGYVSLPDVIIEARAPVEYTYYLDLNAQWDLLLKDGVVHVVAPPIKYNKPAVDVSKLEFEVRKGSVLRRTAQAEENLKQSITYLSHRKARENINLVRETGRKQTGDFVEKWLVKSFSDGTNYPVKVYFPDEPNPLNPLVEAKPRG